MPRPGRASVRSAVSLRAPRRPRVRTGARRERRLRWSGTRTAGGTGIETRAEGNREVSKGVRPRLDDLASSCSRRRDRAAARLRMRPHLRPPLGSGAVGRLRQRMIVIHGPEGVSMSCQSIAKDHERRRQDAGGAAGTNLDSSKMRTLAHMVAPPDREPERAAQREDPGRAAGLPHGRHPSGPGRATAPGCRLRSVPEKPDRWRGWSKGDVGVDAAPHLPRNGVVADARLGQSLTVRSKRRILR